MLGLGASAMGSASSDTAAMGPRASSFSRRFCLAMRSKPSFEALERVLKAILEASVHRLASLEA